MEQLELLLIEETLNEGAATQQTIQILVGDPWKECYLNISFPNMKISRESWYKNALILSAELAANLGTGAAAEILEKHSVPKTNPIWDLNHSDLWQRN